MPKPTVGQKNWGQQLNEFLDEKQDAATRDADVAADVANEASATRAALSATIGARALSRQDTPTTDVTGDGLLYHSGNQTVNVTGGVSLFYIDMQNTSSTGGAASLMTGIKIVCEGDTLDNSAGISITNIGKADAFYIATNGKASGPSIPTGIGIDLNRSGSAEWNPQSAGKAIQVYDWSTTNQGTGGPTALIAYKINNPDTDHKLVYLRSNRRAIEITTPEGPGFTATAPLISVTKNDGSSRWYLAANGDRYASVGTVAYYTMSAGNAGYVTGTTANNLDLRMGSAGLRFLSNTGAAVARLTSTALVIENGTNVTIGSGTGSSIGSGTSKLSFYGATPVVKPTGVTVDAAGIHAALVSLGLIGA